MLRTNNFTLASEITLPYKVTMSEAHHLEENAGETPVLAYGRPVGESCESSRDALWAVLLAMPGLCGFALLIGALLINSKIAWAIGPRVGLGVWAVAFGCAVYSFCHFRRRRKSGWTKLCLTLNWLGIIFTLTPPGWIVLLLAFAVGR